MFKARTIKFIRFFLIGFAIFIWTSEFSSCGSVDEEENPNERRPRERPEENPRDPSQGSDHDPSENPEFDSELDSLDSDSPFVDVNTGEPIAPITPLDQQGISTELDIVFITDASDINIKNITHPQLEEQIGFLPAFLNQRGFDWRVYFMNSEYNPDKPVGRNGQLTDLEVNGGIIISQYLDSNKIYSVYNNNVQEIFTDTIEHDIIQSNKYYCYFPPYCFKNKHNRPLSALNHFLGNSSLLLRESADILVIILTNSDEKPVVKRGFLRVKSRKVTNASSVVDNFQALYPDKKMYAVSIVIKPGDKACLKANTKRRTSSPKGGRSPQTNQPHYATYIPQLSMLTGGIVLSICPTTSSNAYAGPIMQFLTRKQQEEM